MRFIKRILIYVILALVVYVGLVMLIDAKRLAGIKFEKVNESEYQVRLRDNQYILKYVARETISPFFGKARYEFGTGFALVRNDLPERVKNSVTLHEIFHLQDKRPLGTISSEIHANLAAFPYEPLGFLQTIYLTLADPQRIKHYSKFLGR